MADAAGAEHAFFSTCGSSLSVKAAMLSVAGRRGSLLLGRDAHKSVVISGYQAADWLREHHRLDVGLSDHRRIMATVSMADDDHTTSRLRDALLKLVAAAPTLPAPHPVRVPDPAGLELERSTSRVMRSSVQPRRAGQRGRRTRRRRADHPVHPPGIPVIVPGERISSEVIDYLLSGLKAGMVLPDPADPTLGTLRVAANTTMTAQSR